MKETNHNTKKINRKEALRQIGNYSKYAAFTAISTYIILSPKSAQAESVPDRLDGRTF